MHGRNLEISLGGKELFYTAIMLTSSNFMLQTLQSIESHCYAQNHKTETFGFPGTSKAPTARLEGSLGCIQFSFNSFSIGLLHRASDGGLFIRSATCLPSRSWNRRSPTVDESILEIAVRVWHQHTWIYLDDHQCMFHHFSFIPFLLIGLCCPGVV